MQVPRWRSVFVLKNTLLPSLFNPTTITHFASIHSPSSTWEKSKNKSGSDVNRFNRPSKDHARFVVRQRRADAKKALKDLLCGTGCTKTSFKDVDRLPKYGPGTEKKNKGRSFAEQGSKSQNKKTKRKFRRDSFSEDFEEPETIFQATFGNRWYTWSFKGSSFRGSTSGFEWREEPNWENCNTRQWHSTSDTESEYKSSSVGSRSDRIILGLPPTGPLKIEDVKNAFRISALKWHPDRYQGSSSRETAREKFKLC